MKRRSREERGREIFRTFQRSARERVVRVDGKVVDVRDGLVGVPGDGDHVVEVNGIQVTVRGKS